MGQNPEQLTMPWRATTQTQRVHASTAGTRRRRHLVMLELDDSDVWLLGFLRRHRRLGDGFSVWLES